MRDLSRKRFVRRLQIGKLLGAYLHRDDCGYLPLAMLLELPYIPHGGECGMMVAR
jgi:hypothetical protein